MPAVPSNIYFTGSREQGETQAQFLQRVRTGNRAGLGMIVGGVFHGISDIQEFFNRYGNDALNQVEPMPSGTSATSGGNMPLAQLLTFGQSAPGAFDTEFQGRQAPAPVPASVITQHPSAPAGWGVDPATGRLVRITTAPPTGQPALPVEPGEYDAVVKRYTDSGMSLSEAQKRVNDLFAGRPGFVPPVAGAAPAPSPSGTATVAPATTTVDLTKAVTAAFKDTDAYKALSQEAKDFVDIAYNLIEVGGEEEARMFTNAIAQAQAVADPYFKTQLALAKAEVFSAVAEKNFDYETRKEVIERARGELMEDIASNKEFLSLEQQAEIGRQVKEYDLDLLAIADQAAEKGLTFATGARSRALAEERRGEQYQDVVQSGKRRYNLQVKELELKAARGDVDAQKELEALKTKRGFSLQQIGRAAEEVLGSANVPAIDGFAPTGGALGKIEEEKRRAVTSDVAGFMTLQKGFI